MKKTRKEKKMRLIKNSKYGYGINKRKYVEINIEGFIKKGFMKKNKSKEFSSSSKAPDWTIYDNENNGKEIAAVWEKIDGDGMDYLNIRIVKNGTYYYFRMDLNYDKSFEEDYTIKYTGEGSKSVRDTLPDDLQ